MPPIPVQQFFDSISSPSSLIGSEVSIKTTHGDEIKGEVFHYDTKSNSITLKEKAEKPKKTFRVVNINFIGDITKINSSSTPVNFDLPLVNMDKVKLFEQKSLKTAAQQATKIGVGVSKEAQQLFDALSKTYRCAWKGKNILMIDTEIQIHPPYNEESCHGPATAVARVKRVVQGERMKINNGNWQ